MQINRTWAMPNADTFSIKPIAEFVERYMANSNISIDPFARNFTRPTYTNDLNPNTRAIYHLDALVFLEKMKQYGVIADLGIFDPPYSPRQISEIYNSVGRKVTMQDTQSSFYSNLRNAFLPILSDEAIVLSFGWNSCGLGKKRGFKIIEILLVAHGGSHNDTICVAEKRIKG